MNFILLAIFSCLMLCSCGGDYRVHSRAATAEEIALHESERRSKVRRVASEVEPFVSPTPEGMIDIDLIVTHWAEDVGELEFSLSVMDSGTEGLFQVFDKEEMPYDPMAALVVGTIRSRKIRVAKGRVVFDARVEDEFRSDLSISLEAHRYIHISIGNNGISYSVDTEPPGFH